MLSVGVGTGCRMVVQAGPQLSMEFSLASLRPASKRSTMLRAQTGGVVIDENVPSLVQARNRKASLAVLITSIVPIKNIHYRFGWGVCIEPER